LNRNPYRQVQARFAPGASVGVTDLTLLLTTRRLWQLHAGWRNADAAAGIGHNFIHAGVGLPRLADATASYQLTANQGVLFSQPDQRPSHVAHSGRLSLSPWPRQSIEFSASTSTTRSAPSGFLHMDSETQAFELSYRTALSNVIARAYLGDLVAGVERKRMNRRTYFNGVFVGEGSASLLQPYLGWEHVSMLLGGRTQFAARLYVNQGGGVAGNDADSWDAFTNGRVTDVNYVYGTLN